MTTAFVPTIARRYLGLMLHYRVAMATIVALGVSPGPARAAGTTSTLYLISGSTRSIYAIQGSAVVNSMFPIHSFGEVIIAVDGDIRTTGRSSLDFGGLYSLGLTQAGTTYPFPFGSGSTIGLGDGATDGTFNYAVGNGNIYRFDRTWGAPSLLFSPNIPTADTGSTSAEGVTYDPRNNSLWLSVHATFDDVDHYIIGDFKLDGTLISDFELPERDLNNHLLGAGPLALDYADGTLWTPTGPVKALNQFDTSGHLLQSVDVGLSGINFNGMEFNLAHSAVPESSNWALVFCPLVALFGVWQRSRIAPERP